MRFASRYVLCGAVLLAFAGFAREAAAAPMFQLDVSDTSGGAPTTNYLLNTSSHIILSYSDANVSISISIGQSPGGGAFDLDISSVSVANTPAVTLPFTLTFTLSQTELYIPTNGTPANYTFTLTGATNPALVTDSSSVYVDTSGAGNNIPAGGSPVQTLSLSTPALNAPSTINPATGTVAALSGNPLSGPFSMSIVSQLTFLPGSKGSSPVFSYDANIQLTGSNGGGFFQNPEPASLAIWGLGLGMVGLRRLRRRKSA